MASIFQAAVEIIATYRQGLLFALTSKFVAFDPSIVFVQTTLNVQQWQFITNFVIMIICTVTHLATTITGKIIQTSAWSLSKN